MIGVITYAHSIGLTAIAFVREKSDGTLERLFAIGVHPIVIIVGHFLSQIAIVLMQAGIMLSVVVFGFHVPIIGSPVLVILLMILLSCAGISYGLLISAFSSHETNAIQAALGSLFPVLLISGILWPATAIPQ